MRKAGDIEWRSAADAAALIGGTLAADSPFVEVEIGIKHLGINEARRNMRRMRRLRLDELRRIKREQRALLEAGGTKEDAPELFPETLAEGDVRTPEGEEELATVCREIVASVLAGHRGLGLPDDAKPEAVLDELERVGLLELFWTACMEVQAVRPQFPAADQGAGGGDDAA